MKSLHNTIYSSTWPFLKKNGHVHQHSVRTWYGTLDKRYYNTCVDVVYPKTGNVFVNLETVKSYFGL